MNCPSCNSSHIRKNGKKSSKQNYICVSCGRQFIDKYEPSRTYSHQVKEECLKMYLNGMGFRGIERVKGVNDLSLQFCDRALAIATQLNISLVKECQEFKELLMKNK